MSAEEITKAILNARKRKQSGHLIIGVDEHTTIRIGYINFSEYYVWGQLFKDGEQQYIGKGKKTVSFKVPFSQKEKLKGKIEWLLSKVKPDDLK